MIQRQHLLESICFGLITYATIAYAAPVTWVARSPNNDMNDSSNWDPNLPGSNDGAIFDSKISGIDTNPTENSSPFSISNFSFPNKASIFNFNFNNNTLTFNGMGVVGLNTNPNITITNTNNTSFPGDLVSFSGGTGTCGSSIITSANSATLTGSRASSSMGPQLV